MEDRQIVTLYWNRKENAIVETAAKYGRYLNSISYNILADSEDAKECVNDTYHDAWNTIPPHRPSNLSTFLGKITRRISIDRWRKKRADKRGGGEIALALDELEECLAGGNDVEKEFDRKETVKLINKFLKSLPETERTVFIRRYWYLDSISSICDRFDFSQSKVASMLHRTRLKLKDVLEKEGFQ